MWLSKGRNDTHWSFVKSIIPPFLLFIKKGTLDFFICYWCNHIYPPGLYLLITVCDSYCSLRAKKKSTLYHSQHPQLVIKVYYFSYKIPNQEITIFQLFLFPWAFVCFPQLSMVMTILCQESGQLRNWEDPQGCHSWCGEADEPGCSSAYRISQKSMKAQIYDSWHFYNLLSKNCSPTQCAVYIYLRALLDIKEKSILTPHRNEDGSSSLNSYLFDLVEVLHLWSWASYIGSVLILASYDSTWFLMPYLMATWDFAHTIGYSTCCRPFHYKF